MVGLSMGGWICFEFGLIHPEVAASLVLSDSGGVRAGLSEEQIQEKKNLFQASAKIAIEQGREMMVDNTIQLMFAPEFINNNPQAVALVKQRIIADPGVGYARTILGVFAESWGQPPQVLMDRLKNITSPALVVAGEVDQLTPLPTQEALHQAIPESIFKVIPGAGHVPPVEKPDEWNRVVLEFLESVEV
jgi:pimeloyl-ACP methyl ester carboxylesterase